MSITRYFFDSIFADDDLGVSSTAQKRWKLVDTEQYDLKPKKEYYQRLVKQKEEELERLRRARDSMVAHYTAQESSLLSYIERIKKDL